MELQPKLFMKDVLFYLSAVVMVFVCMLKGEVRLQTCVQKPQSEL